MEHEKLMTFISLSCYNDSFQVRNEVFNLQFKKIAELNNQMLLDVCSKYKGIEHLIVEQKCDFSNINKSKN